MMTNPDAMTTATNAKMDDPTEEMIAATAEASTRTAVETDGSLPDAVGPPDFHLETLDAETLLALVAAGCPEPWSFDTESSRIHSSDGLPLCGPLAVLGRFRDAAGGGWSRLIGFIDLDGRIQTALVPNRQIEGGRGLGAMLAGLADQGLWMAGRASGIGALLRSWETPRRGLIVDRAGWVRVDGVRRGYVLPRGATITRPGDGEVIVLRGAPLGRAPTTAGTLAAWQETVGRHALGNPLMMTMLCSALSGALLDICGLTTVGFNFFGRTSRGKTTALRAALSVYPDYPEHPPRWTGTSTGLELLAARQVDGLLALDEYPTDPRPDAITLLMALGNGTGPARGTGQITLREQMLLRCAILSTAEFPVVEILEKAGRTPPPGLSVRLVDVPAERAHGAFDNLHGMTGHQFAKFVDQHARENFGHVGPAFVRRILERSQSDLEAIAALQVTIHRELKASLGLQECPEVAERVLDSFAVVALAGELAIKARLLPWPRGSAREAVQVIAAEWWRHRTRPQELVDLLREVEDLKDLLLPFDTDGAYLDFGVS